MAKHNMKNPPIYDFFKPTFKEPARYSHEQAKTGQIIFSIQIVNFI